MYEHGRKYKMPKTRKQNMNSFFDISLPTANGIYNAANIVLIIGAILVTIGTIAVFWSAGIRDRYSDERISSNEAETARAKESAAVANQKAVEAELKLEEFKAPRHLTAEQISSMGQVLVSFAGIHFDVGIIPGDPEAENFLPQIEAILTAAHWVEVDWKAESVTLVNKRAGMPIAGIVNMTGIIVQMHPQNVKKFEAAAIALVERLINAGVVSKAEGGVGYPNDNTDALHILIGKKP
jgi:hypothetical protein